MVLDLSHAGLTKPHNISRNLPSASLIEHAINLNNGRLSEHGAFVTQTGKYTGRSPNDKFIVRDEETEKTVWWGKVNQPITTEYADALAQRLADYLSQSPVFVEDCFAGTDLQYRLPIRVIAERPWHALFAKNMFLNPTDDELKHFEPQFTVLHAPGFKADPQRDGTKSEVAVVIDFKKRKVLICGTEYAGEIKKSVFTLLNYLLPAKGVLGMHCSANMSDNDDVAIFFGLSGTGKTTLSADQERKLIGDDEHGWSENGVFNFEGGCYAKVIRLSPKDEPEIYATTQKFGTILENVVMDESTRKLDLNDERYTENTRASYNINEIPNALMSGKAGHPDHIIMLTCDAFGVLPPLAKMTTDQAMYHFLSGYTARVAGTERGVTQPTAVFSACFGAPFMARHPSVYADLLGKRIAHHKVQCWLVNTGWSGGPYGVGERMKIKWTRALLHAVLSGNLDNTEFAPHPMFQVGIPKAVEGVPSEILDPKTSWSSAAEYEIQAKHVVGLFQENFKIFAEQVSPAIRNAQPVF